MFVGGDYKLFKIIKSYLENRLKKISFLNGLGKYEVICSWLFFYFLKIFECYVMFFIL